MPPGDTIILNNLNGLPDSLRHIADSLMGLHSQLLPDGEKKPIFPIPQWEVFLIILIIVLASAYFYIIKPASANKKKVREILKEGSPEKAILEIQYDHWLSKYNPYYNSLPDKLRKRFLRRTIEFRLSKEFHFHFLKEEEYMSVVISGAAVQLTFGLKHFLIEYFNIINVVQKEYKIPGHDEIFEGHVTGYSINISWNNFLEGYENYSDSDNVGLHELAHAISFDIFNGNNENDSERLRKRLHEYVYEASPVFKELQQGKRHELDDYAATNFEEFWAVSVETFFESSEEFRNKMPGLYQAICDLLNQDPLLPDKIINKSMAGLAN
jgi:Mlc titration factor MtfA (ptsG expression regulator)